MYRPISLRVAFALGALALATACGDSTELRDAGDGLDVSPPDRFVDAEVEVDAAVADLGPPDSGATPCQLFCATQSECLAAQSVRGLQFFGREVHCTTETPGLEGCAARCEPFNPTVACLECSAMCGGRCNGVCPRLGETQWPILDHQTCWFGAERPTESCTEPRSVRSYSGGAYPEDTPQPFYLEYSGTATVVDWPSRIVRTPSGLEFGLGVGVYSEIPVPSLETGSTVLVEIQSSCSFWCTSAYALRNAAGLLLLAGWSGRGPIPIPELELGYEGRSCLPLPREHYFELELELVANEVHIPMGQYAEVGDFYVFNGLSTRFYAVTVSENPGGESSGVVVRRQ